MSAAEETTTNRLWERKEGVAGASFDRFSSVVLLSLPDKLAEIANLS